MWQIEDLLRATQCQEERIDQLIISRYKGSSEELSAIRAWYLELADMMRTEGKLERGHLDINRIVLMQLEELHRSLLKNPNDYVYQGLHYQVLPSVIQLRSKGADQEASDLETCFNALYGYLTLTLKGEAISDETKKSMKQMSALLAMLSHRYTASEEELDR